VIIDSLDQWTGQNFDAKHPLSDPGFEASELFPNRQVFLLSFFITLIESVDLRGDFVKTPINFISKRLKRCWSHLETCA